MAHTDNIPCMVPPLQERVGNYVIEQVVTDILSGELYVLEVVDDTVIYVFTHCRLKGGTNTTHTPKPILTVDCNTECAKINKR